jgi:hypothetical protein
LPDTDEDTHVGPIAVAPDGTLYAGVFFYDDDDAEYYWKVCMSEDDGYTWDDTDIDELESEGTGLENKIVSVVVSPNYSDDETVYVGTYDSDDGPMVWRLEEAGDDATALKPIVDSHGDEADVLFCLDVFTDDDDYNWILAGTDLDALVLRDRVFEDWRDQELGNIYPMWEDDADEWKAPAYEVAFAPDFEDSELIWAVTEEPDWDSSFWANAFDDPYLITSTESPGNWGQEVDEAILRDDDDLDVWATPWLDIDFPDNYDSDPDSGDTYVILGVADPPGDGGGIWMDSPGEDGVYLIEGVEGDGDPDTDKSVAIELTEGDDPDGEAITSIAVSGEFGDDMVILAGQLHDPIVHISEDGDGLDWDEVDKNPTGTWEDYPIFDAGWDLSWTHVIMEADVTWGNATFDTEESIAFAATFGAESAVSRSDDGGWVFNQVGLIDTDIDDVWDLALHPEFPDETVFILQTYDGDHGTDSLWLTENGDEDEPDYVRILCADDDGLGNFEVGGGGLWLVEYAQDASGIFIFGYDDDNDESIWMSDDDGQTFGDHREVKDGTDYGWINDWVIIDDDTILAATYCDDDDNLGFFKTINAGLSWTSVDTDGDGDGYGEMWTIAVSPDFDAEDEEGYILLGGADGEIMMSDDVGDGFDWAEDEELSGLSGYIYVAFDADFADEDADGYMMIYAADDEGDAVVEGEVADIDDVDWADLEDDENDDTQDVYCVGLEVAEDNALYVMSCEGGGAGRDVEVDGDFRITGDNSSTTDVITITSLPDVTETSGDFEDDESVDITLTDLVATATDQVGGRVWIEGNVSGASGYFDITITTSDFEVGETVSVTDSSLYAIVTGAVAEQETAVYRLLLHESNSEWESEGDDDLADPCHLWLTTGSNVLWTLDDDELWVLEDTLSGSPTLDAPPDGYKSDVEEEMRVSWDEMRGIDEDYHVKYTNVDPDTTDSVYTDETSILLTQLSATSEYEWKVRAAPQSEGNDTWSSRWSEKWTFFTALGEPPWAPTLYTPGGVWQYSGIDVELMPAFSWESAKTADSYQFILADNAEFTSPLVNTKTPESAYQLDFELDYNSNYFWKVQAYKGTEALSRWSDIGAFTTIMEPEPPPPSPPPPATVTQPAPAPVVIPTPIPPILLWVIVGIGAALIIAVIVLIVRTRRAV